VAEDSALATTVKRNIVFFMTFSSSQSYFGARLGQPRTRTACIMNRRTGVLAIRDWASSP